MRLVIRMGPVHETGNKGWEMAAYGGVDIMAFGIGDVHSEGGLA